jgi:cobaltochelatase CobS
MSDLVAELENLRPTFFDAGSVFSGSPTGRIIKGYDKPSMFTSAINANHI